MQNFEINQDDGLNVRFLPHLSLRYPWTVCFRHEPSRGFRTLREAEEYISHTRTWRAARAAKAARENEAG